MKTDIIVMVQMMKEKDIARIIDANLNRAREGTRILEEVARFILDDSSLTKRIKEIRHNIVQACLGFGFDHRELVDARDSEGDVGRTVKGSLESDRKGIEDIIASNFARIEEALRVIEEFGKLVDTDSAVKIKDIRYEVYSLEKDFLI